MEADSAFRARLQKVKEELLVEFAAEKAISNVSVSEAELTKYYEDNKEKFNTGDTVNASHVLVATEEEAEKILGEIKSGEISFEEAAKKYSSCPSKENGGNLGDFGRGQMVPEFDSAVFEMSEGEISDTPVKTQFGYHLIKLNSKSEAKPIALQEIHDELYGMLLNDKRRSAFESKINQLKIMYPVDMAAF
ncbi:MAG: peptidylprolyl isomerase [Clostridia bacterium]|nr:peptidylprolyl isomerase [Clostridia bacterium]